MHAEPRRCWAQGSIERANKDVEELLASWMAADNKSKKWPMAFKYKYFTEKQKKII